jgi:UDP-glucose:(heptosyl)LPS alpha-1,3-glucosyltransferase
MKKKKIAILYSGKKSYGGIYTFFRDILKDYNRNEFQLDLFSVTESLPLENTFSNVFLFKTNKYILNFIFKYNLHIIYSSLTMLFFLPKLKKYDKIIINQELSFPIGFFLKKSITIIHGTSLNPMKVWFKSKKYLFSLYYFFLSIHSILAYFASQKIYTVSNYTKEIINKYNKKVIVCGWGVNRNFWEYNKNIKKEDFNFKKEDFLMIFVGRFDIGKGKEELIGIMNYYKKRNKNIKLLVISKKPNNFSLNNIYFYENISEEKLKDLYSISDLFIFPTKYEGYGSVIAEALSIGLPIITTNTGLGNILKKKYIYKYVNYINILEPLSKHKEYIKRINSLYELWTKNNKNLKKMDYDIKEIDLNSTLNCWREVFFEK